MDERSSAVRLAHERHFQILVVVHHHVAAAAVACQGDVLPPVLAWSRACLHAHRRLHRIGLSHRPSPSPSRRRCRCRRVGTMAAPGASVCARPCASPTHRTSASASASTSASTSTDGRTTQPGQAPLHVHAGAGCLRKRHEVLCLLAPACRAALREVIETITVDPWEPALRRPVPQALAQSGNTTHARQLHWLLLLWQRRRRCWRPQFHAIKELIDRHHFERGRSLPVQGACERMLTHRWGWGQHITGIRDHNVQRSLPAARC